MHRANAAKALRTDAVEKWQRIAAAAARENTAYDEEGLQALLPTHDSTGPGAIMSPFCSICSLLVRIVSLGNSTPAVSTAVPCLYAPQLVNIRS